jgi:cytochrome c peroxidase
MLCAIVPLVACRSVSGQALQPIAASDRNAAHAAATSDSSALKPIAASFAVDSPKVQLGKSLFNDPRFSRDNSMSCASCHNVRDGGGDGRRTAIGIDGQIGDRNTPTVLNAALNFAQFWDGRAGTLAEQATGPVTNPLEMDSSWDQVLLKLGADSSLAKRFDAIYADGLTAGNLVDAIVAYEEALITPNAAFDRFLRGDKSALTEKARLGYSHFVDFGCAACHQGRNVGGNMYQQFGVIGDYLGERGHITTSDLGRFNVTKKPGDRYLFKVPSLRNVARTAPYFHDGTAETLEAAVRIMAIYQLGRPISDEQIAAIVAFLDALSGEIDESLL